jgi:ferredoxin
MKVIIDAETCNGHGRCYSLSPDVFDSDDEGHSVAMVDVVDGELLEAALVAASNCPERAIRVVDE